MVQTDHFEPLTYFLGTRFRLSTFNKIHGDPNQSFWRAPLNKDYSCKISLKLKNRLVIQLQHHKQKNMVTSINNKMSLWKSKGSIMSN